MYLQTPTHKNKPLNPQYNCYRITEKYSTENRSIKRQGTDLKTKKGEGLDFEIHTRDNNKNTEAD